MDATERTGVTLDIEASAPSDAPAAKFADPDRTVSGERRASVALERLETLWINTGTLCNITCVNCYIESSPENDRLVYITAAEAAAYFDEIAAHGLATREIGFTGGEPFLNPHLPAMIEDALARGHDVLVLTNGMQPLLRPKTKAAVASLVRRYGDRLRLRVSLDHYTRQLHESERGRGTWTKALAGLDWLTAIGASIAIAGRTCWGETETAARAGYAALITEHRWSIDPADQKQLMLLPEMEMGAEVPEITERCWSILGKRPSELMCATSRMIVKRKGAAAPVVLPCTLLPYDTRFEMGATLADANVANGGVFTDGAVKLCHVNCAKFCVLGGGSCS